MEASLPEAWCAVIPFAVKPRLWCLSGRLPCPPSAAVIASCMLSPLLMESWSMTARLQVCLAVRFWQGNALQLAFQSWREGITLQQHEQQQVSQVGRSCCTQQLSPPARHS